MSRFIAEFGGRYCEWSTVVDAPTTYLMTEEALKEYILAEYGEEGLKELPQRMERVRQTGCSMRGWEKADLLSFNRAGPDESHLKTEKAMVARFTQTGATAGGPQAKTTRTKQERPPMKQSKKLAQLEDEIAFISSVCRDYQFVHNADDIREAIDAANAIEKRLLRIREDMLKALAQKAKDKAKTSAKGKKTKAAKAR